MVAVVCRFLFVCLFNGKRRFCVGICLIVDELGSNYGFFLFVFELEYGLLPF